MPRLSCTRVSNRQHGFSLLELLVALIVVVLITSMVTLTVSSGGQDIRLESLVRNLEDVASYALDEAQMTGQDYGLLIEEEYDAGSAYYAYSWYVRELDGWKSLDGGHEVFATTRLPGEILLQLELEDAVVTEQTLEEEEKRRATPQVVFYSSGETTVGALDVRQRDSGELLWRLEWDLLGRFDLLRRGEDKGA